MTELEMVPAVGLEPTRLAPPDFESGVSTISPRWQFVELELY